MYAPCLYSATQCCYCVGPAESILTSYRFAVPHLKKRKQGAIIVISSINGTRTFSNTGSTVYSATKAGQLAMAKVLAPELAEYKIRINVVCPGAIDTSIFIHGV